MEETDRIDSEIDRASVSSSFNEAILMLSTDTLSDTMNELPRTSIDAPISNLTRTIEEKTTCDCSSRIEARSSRCEHIQQENENSMELVDNQFRGSFHELNISNIQKNILWPALTRLQKSLVRSDDNDDKGAEEIIENLSEVFDNDPLNFTEHLLTIIEEDSNIYSSEISAASSDTSSPNISKEDDSTKYMSLKKLSFEVPEKERQGTHKSPRILIHKTPKTVKYGRGLQKSPRVRNVFYRKTPRIIIDPGTPVARKNNVESPLNRNEEDDYLTAESEIDDVHDTTMLEDDELENESINMSKMAQRHGEWVETFDKVSHYNPVKKTFKTTPLNRTGKVANYVNKLEKRWQRELQQKRAKCFEAIDRLVKKAAANKPHQVDKDSNSSGKGRKPQSKFFNALVAYSDYTQAINQKDSLKSTKPSPKKQRRSISRPPSKSVKDDILNSRKIANSAKKGGRKSLGQNIKSPIGRKRSPRRSITLKTSSKKSPVVMRKNNRGQAEIDRSSIPSVAQLRMLFSPRPNLPGTSKSMIPRLKAQAPKIYISTMSVKPSISKSRESPTNSSRFAGSSSSKIQFKHVKSPVAEYIRGERM